MGKEVFVGQKNPGGQGHNTNKLGLFVIALTVELPEPS